MLLYLNSSFIEKQINNVVDLDKKLITTETICLTNQLNPCLSWWDMLSNNLFNRIKNNGEKTTVMKKYQSLQLISL